MKLSSNKVIKDVTIVFLVLIPLLVVGCTKNPEATEEDYCVIVNSSENMSFAEAKQIALASECVKEGPLKDTYFCNENTGTWWIDLDIKKEGCSPACVINVKSKQAEINWRCMGLIPP